MLLLVLRDGPDDLHLGAARCAQVLAGPEEMWLFLQVERVVRLPGPLVSSPVRPISRREVVLVVSADGAARRISVGPGPPFHRHLGRIFRLGERFYLLNEWSSVSSVFVWESDRFAPLPRADSDALLNVSGLPGLPGGEIGDALDALTVRAGWESLQEEVDFYFYGGHWVGCAGDEPLAWRGRAYRWELNHSWSGAALGLRKDGSPVIPVLEFDTWRRPVREEDYAR